MAIKHSQTPRKLFKISEWHIDSWIEKLYSASVNIKDK
ncbi:MAG: hypothetical protein ACD_2C00057G0002 [uncultured bacterium (gcode 4)]|uniref:Uncharacterized protein n=1 Tax=uncultured bacterium (gcode 4) TaxID=1234023 RepID=K2G6R4_9BACT|nr:MAG: hypothetical protein ACD_2C00057G0002 [uncultured bacterium (gcode 4)]